MTSRRVYVGWDSREDIAYQVCKHSIQRFAPDVEVIPLKLKELKNAGLITRPDDAKASTEFTFSRFLVPHLNDYEGWALFVDCDFLFLRDVNELFDAADTQYAVMVAKHEYNVSDNSTKMDGKTQHAYPRKNWSSAMLFNCAHQKNKDLLYPEHINSRDMSYLHRLQWLNDDEIGQISHEWNWLVGHYSEPQDGHPKALHYTLGTPFMEGYENCEYAELWHEEARMYYKSW